MSIIGGCDKLPLSQHKSTHNRTLTAKVFVGGVPTVVLAITEVSVVEADAVVTLEHPRRAVAVVQGGGVGA